MNKFRSCQREEPDRWCECFLHGAATVSGTAVSAKTAAKLGDGDVVTIEAGDEPIEILFMCSNKLNEPVEWYGPIVMNTSDEIIQAIDEIHKGTFIKQVTTYDSE